MKKKKWLINFSTLALALCVMAFGVYAAKSASLTTSGSIGFISHDADVTVVGTISGAMRGKNLGYAPVGTEEYTAEETGDVAWADSFTTINDDGVINEQDYLRQTDPATKWTFGDIYFDDMNQTGDAVSDTIIITLQVTNYSDFNVLVEVTGLDQTITGVDVQSSKAIITANSGTPDYANVTITFKLNDTGKANGVTKASINPTLSVARTNYSDLSDLPDAVVSENGWNGEVTEDGKFQITQAPTVEEGETLKIPSKIEYKGEVYDVQLATDEDYGGYVKNAGTADEVFVVTSVPEVQTFESVSSEALNAKVATTSMTSNALAVTTNIKATADTDEIYVPSYILSDNVVYSTTITYVSEGWGIITCDNIKCINRVPVSEGVTTLIIPSIFDNNGVVERITKIYNQEYAENYYVPWIIDNLDNYSKIIISDGIKEIGGTAFSSSSAINSVEIPASVTTIGNSAFSRCSNLASVTFAEGSQIKSIGENAFSGCQFVSYDTNGLCYLGTEKNPNMILYMANSSTILSEVEIAEGCKLVCGSAFKSCQKLTSVEIPASVTSIGDYAFYGCTSLETVSFESGSNLQTIGDQVFRNTVITSIEIPASVTSIGSSAFYGCTNLASVTFAESSQLNSIGYKAFAGCTGLTGIEIPASVTSIGFDAFTSCKSLAKVNFEVGCKLEILNRVFAYDTSLTDITIPSSIKEISASFQGCTSLNSISFEEGSQIEYISEDAFESCPAASSFDSNGLCYFGSKSNPNLVLVKVNPNITSVTISTSCVLIAPYAFNESTIVNVVIPSSVLGIGKYAFNKCSNLESLTFDSGSKLQYMESIAIYDCDKLTSLEFPENCIVNEDDYPSVSCNLLTTVIINSPQFAGTTYYSSDSKDYKDSFTYIYINENITSIGTSVTRYHSEVTSYTGDYEGMKKTGYRLFVKD